MDSYSDFRVIIPIITSNEDRMSECFFGIINSLFKKSDIKVQKM